MPDGTHSQQYAAAQSSARKRRTARLVRQLNQTRPLTMQQRAEVLAAAADIPVVNP